MNNLTTKIFIVLVIALFIGLGLFYFNKNFNQKNNKGESPEVNLEQNQNEKNKVSNKAEYKIIAFGDSLTAGYGLNLEDSYPEQLEKKLIENNYNVKIINAGVSGETSFGNLERAEFIKNQNPDIVILGIGGNDALRGLQTENTKSNIEKTINILSENKSKIFLLKMQAPNNLGLKYKNDFDSIYESISKDKNIILIPFIVNEVFLNKNLMLNDRIHPNKEGYKMLVEKYIYPEIIKYLNQK
jgi:acyl-CoA thioesterase-1